MTKRTSRPNRRSKSIRKRDHLPDGSLASAKPTAVGDILKSLMKKSALGKTLRLAQIWDNWEQIAGPKLAPHGRPHGVRGKTLVIQVDSSVWMNVYTYHKWDIIKRINRAHKRELISDIFILLTSE